MSTISTKKVKDLHLEESVITGLDISDGEITLQVDNVVKPGSQNVVTNNAIYTSMHNLSVNLTNMLQVDELSSTTSTNALQNKTITNKFIAHEQDIDALKSRAVGTKTISEGNTDLVESGAVWSYVRDQLRPSIVADDRLISDSVNAVENQALYREFYNLGLSGGDFISVDLDQKDALSCDSQGQFVSDSSNVFMTKADSTMIFDKADSDSYYKLRVVQFHNSSSLSTLASWKGALFTGILDTKYYAGSFDRYDAATDEFVTENIDEMLISTGSERWNKINSWVDSLFSYKSSHPSFIDGTKAQFIGQIEDNGFICLSSLGSNAGEALNSINNILTIYRIPHDTPASTKVKDIDFEFVGRSNPNRIVVNTLAAFNETMDFDFTDSNIILDPSYDYIYVIRTTWNDAISSYPLMSEESFETIRWSRYMQYRLKDDIIQDNTHTNLWIGQEIRSKSLDTFKDLTLEELKTLDTKTGVEATNAKYILNATFNVKQEKYTLKFKPVATKEYVDFSIQNASKNSQIDQHDLSAAIDAVVNSNLVAKSGEYTLTSSDEYRFDRSSGVYGFIATLSALQSDNVPTIITHVKLANSSTSGGSVFTDKPVKLEIYKHDGLGDITDFNSWQYLATSTNSPINTLRFKDASMYMDFSFSPILLNPATKYLFRVIDLSGETTPIRSELLSCSTEKYLSSDVNYVTSVIPIYPSETLTFSNTSVKHEYPLIEIDGYSPTDAFAKAAQMIHGGSSDSPSHIDVVIDTELNKTSTNPVANKAIYEKFLDLSSQLSVDTDLSETSTHAVQNKAIYSKISQLEQAISEIDPGVVPPEYVDFGIPPFTGKQYSDMLTSNVLDWPLSASTMDTIDIDMTRTLYPMLSVVFNNITDGGNAGNTHTTADVVEVDYTESYLSSAKFRIPTIVKTNSGRLIASYDIRWNSHNDIAKTPYTDQCTGFSYSDDGGKTWSKNPAVLMGWYYDDGTGHVQSGVSDPSLLYDDENDVVFCFAIAGNGTQSQTTVNQAQIKDARRTQLVMSYSTDNGETWSKAEIVTDKIFDSDGVSQNWICTSDNTSGPFGFIFGCCSNGIRLTHQQNNADNGLVLAVQLWPTNGLYGLGSTRCTFAHFYPTYQKDKFGNKKATVKFVLTESLIGDICGGAHEGQLAEDENGKIAYICKSMSIFNNVCFRIFTTTDCGRTWTVVGNTDVLDTDNQPTGDKIFSEIANTPIDRVKPSIAYSEYMHRWFISYSNHTNRGCPVIRYADSIPDNPTEAIWKTFDVCDFSTQSAGYTNLISIDKGTSIGIIYESHLDSCPNSAHNSKSFGYNSYSFLPKKQTLFSSTWREFDRYTNEGASANDTCKALSFKLSDFTNDKFALMKTFTYRGQNSSTAMPSGYQNISTRIALYESDDAQPNSITASTNATLVTQLGHKAISKPLNWSIDGTADTCYNGRKYEFVFEHPVTLKQGKTYFLAQYADDVEYPTLADYFEAFKNSDGNTQPTYFYVTLLKIAPSNGARVGVIGYNASFKEISYTRDTVSRRYSPLCWISSSDPKSDKSINIDSLVINNCIVG